MTDEKPNKFTKEFAKGLAEGFVTAIGRKTCIAIGVTVCIMTASLSLYKFNAIRSDVNKQEQRVATMMEHENRKLDEENKKWDEEFKNFDAEVDKDLKAGDEMAKKIHKDLSKK